MYAILKLTRALNILLFSQASSYALDDKGRSTMFASMFKKMTIRKKSREFFQEQDKIVKYICSHHQASDQDDDDNGQGPSFDFIVTRPSELIWDRPSRKKLLPSKSVRPRNPCPASNLSANQIVSFCKLLSLNVTRS